MSNRDDFERICADIIGPSPKRIGNDYRLHQAQIAWMIWQRATAPQTAIEDTEMLDFLQGSLSKYGRFVDARRLGSGGDIELFTEPTQFTKGPDLRAAIRAAITRKQDEPK